MSCRVIAFACVALTCCWLTYAQAPTTASAPDQWVLDPPGWSILMAQDGELHRGRSTTGGELLYITVPNTLLPGQELKAVADNPQPSAEACAAACAAFPRCTVFNYCPPGGDARMGCAADPGGIITLPAGSCQLLWQQAPESSASIAVFGKDPATLTTAGALIQVPNVTDIPGYNPFPGRAFLNNYNFPCPGTLVEGICRLPAPGGPKDLAAACNAEPRCLAFTWNPRGRSGQNFSLGSLKGLKNSGGPGGTDSPPALDMSLSNWNPGGVMMLKEGVQLINRHRDPPAPAASSPAGPAQGDPSSQTSQLWGIVVSGQARFTQLPGSRGGFIEARNAIIPGPLVVEGKKNFQPTLAGCAQACAQESKCTVFNWCPVNGSSCLMDATGGEPLLPGGCELRNQATLDEGNSIILLAQGGGIETVGGTPMVIETVELPGYRSLPGQLFLGQYRLTCPGSLRHDSCRLLGTAEQLAAACDAHPDCQMVEFSPLGRDNVNGSMGTLKGTIGDRNAPIDLAKSNWNPRIELLVREDTPIIIDGAGAEAESEGQAEGQGESTSSGGGLSGGVIAGIAVGATVVAALLLVASLVPWRRQRKQAGQGSKPLAMLPLHSGGREGSGSGSVELEMGAGRMPGEVQLAAVAVPASPTGSLTTPRRRGTAGQSPSGWEVAPGLSAAAAAAAISGSNSASAYHQGSASSTLGQAAAVGSEAETCTAALEGGSSPSQQAQQAQQPMPALAWASQMLAESIPQWEETCVKEEDITFLQGPDGRPISLGAGSFGSVYKVLLGRHTLCAAKIMEWHGRRHMQLEFVQEAAMLRRLRHPNIVGFMGVCVTAERGILLMEYCAGKDLDAAMNARSRANGARLFDWYNRGRKSAVDIASGLAFLHHSRTLHLDIKPHNVLLGRDGTSKLGDVGFARLMSRTHLSIDGRFGTFDWTAPEVLLGRGATDKSDIWSFGVVLWEICSGTRPRRGQLTPLRAPEQCPPELVALQQACVSEHPDERPTAAEVLEALLNLPPSRPPSQRPGPAPEPPQGTVAPQQPGPLIWPTASLPSSAFPSTPDQTLAAEVGPANTPTSPVELGLWQPEPSGLVPQRLDSLPSPFAAPAQSGQRSVSGVRHMQPLAPAASLASPFAAMGTPPSPGPASPGAEEGAAAGDAVASRQGSGGGGDFGLTPPLQQPDAIHSPEPLQIVRHRSGSDEWDSSRGSVQTLAPRSNQTGNSSTPLLGASSGRLQPGGGPRWMPGEYGPSTT